ncbi:MAG: glycosyl transferase [Burkholderiales bacterium]|jgi:glycosyltransferase involved in cell wall biosynthesis|nr:glycosyl transferase [Burkholderiales bacterium]
MAKICHITSAHKRNDIRIFVKECVTLAKAGHEVTLIVADDLAYEIHNGVQIYSVGKQETRKQRMLKTPKDIYSKVIQLKPDVIHFHDPELMLIGCKLARRGYKVVYDVHEDLPKQILDKYWLPKITRPLVSKYVAYLEKKCAKLFYGIVAATPIIARRFKQYNSNTIDVCNYPILAELDVAYTSWGQRENSICYIGSISKTRGIEPIIAACGITHIPLELAGIFSGDITLDELKQQGSGEYINYHGVLNRPEITNLLQKVKIGLVTLFPTPSYVESLPIKMFEYMLAGIPVIASNFPLWQEIVGKYACGILVDPTNHHQIAGAILNLINNQDMARQMGENGRKIVLEHFNWENEQQKLINFYIAIKGESNNA